MVRGARDLLWVIGTQLTSLGYRSTFPNRPPFPLRASYGGEVLYRLTPRVEAGLGASAESAHGSGEYAASLHSRALIEPGIDALTAFATVSYLLPINRSAGLRLSGGPMLARVTVLDQGHLSGRRGQDERRPDRHGLGPRGAPGLGFGDQPRRAEGPLHRGRGDGSEGLAASRGRKARCSWSAIGWWKPGTSRGGSTSSKKAGLTRLMILPEKTWGPGPSREAVYSLAGIDIRAGFRIRI